MTRKVFTPIPTFPRQGGRSCFGLPPSRGKEFRRGSTVEQHRLACFAPRCFVGPGERVEIGRCGSGIVYPLPQQRATVDEIDGEAATFVLVREVAPQLVIRPQLPRGLENKLYPALPDSRVSTTVKHREDNQLIRTNAEVH